jgi:hypothetical protein
LKSALTRTSIFYPPAGGKIDRRVGRTFPTFQLFVVMVNKLLAYITHFLKEQLLVYPPFSVHQDRKSVIST